MNKEKGSINFAAVFVLIIALAIAYFIFAFPFMSWKYETSAGNHTGYITAVEKNGLIWKTGTAFLKTDTQSSQEDRYCVIDPSVYAQLTAASVAKAHVTVGYTDWLHKSMTVCDGESAIITSVTVDAN